MMHSPINSESVSRADLAEPKPMQWIATWIYTFFQLMIVAIVIGFPITNLIHPSPWQRSLGFWHSLFASITTAVFIYTGTFALQLQNTVNLRRLQQASFISAIAAIFSLLSGYRALARYQAPVDDAAGVFIRVTTPIMQVVMHWHLLISFSLLGLAISTFYISWLYGERLLDPQPPYPQVRDSLSLCLGWMLLLSAATFIAGICVAKVHSL